jgi:phage nucleotide-binding protein
MQPKPTINPKEGKVTPLTLTTLGNLPIKKVQNRSGFLNILVYGDSGVGKTTLAGSADAVPQLRPVLVIDVEGGTESLVRQYPNVDHIRVTTWREMLQVANALQQGTSGYQTIVLDSLTEIQKISMTHIMQELVKEKPEADPDVPGIREWGKNLEHMRRLVRHFRDLHLNVIFTALSKTDKDPLALKRETLPSLSGKMAAEVSGLLDIVAYMYMRQVKEDGKDKQLRLLLTKKTERQVAKDRTNSLDTVVQDPTMQAIYDQIHKTKPQSPDDDTVYPDTVTIPQTPTEE